MASFPDTGPRPSRLTRRLMLSGPLLLWVLLAVSHAQLTMDGSLGPRGPLAGPQYRIGAELGQIRGGNLFHSFGAFNVPTGGSATFTGPNTIANIVSRVTGGQPSSIDGLLRSEIAGAHLYLLNPSGVMFGSNARLEVSGSFHVSTADYLRFMDGTTFSANLEQASVLTVAPPAAFGFLRANPAAIAVQGSTLQVPAGNALSVVGGDMTIQGSDSPITADTIPTLYAPSGRIQLTSVAAPGEVGFSPLELAPDLQEDSFARLGRIELSRAALVTARTEGSRQAGAIEVRGGQVMLSGGSQLTSNTAGTGSTGAAGRIVVAAPVVSMTEQGSIEARARTGSRGNGGEVEVRADTVTLDGGATINVRTSGAGRGGTIAVRAGTLTLTREGRIEVGTSTEGQGNGGTIAVRAGTLTLTDGTSILATTRSSTGGNAGTIDLQVGRLTLTDGALINVETTGPGQGGLLAVMADEAIVITGERTDSSQLNARTRGSGAGGRIVVTAPRVTISDGGLIRAGTIGAGPGGTIELQTGTLMMTGGTISTITSPTATGPGGSITVRAGTLTLTDGGQILTRTEGPGQGGLLTVMAGEAIVIAGRHPQSPQESSRLASETFGSGAGGRVVVDTPRLTLSNGGTISASSTGGGAAGTLGLDIGETFRSQGGHVTTAAERAGGGTIVLTAGRLVQLVNSELTTSVQGGGSDAGNLTLEAPFAVADGSQIVANAFGGRGGNILINAGVFLADPMSQVSASSTMGISGMVDIRAPVTSLGGTLAPLPQAFVSAAALLPAQCAARAQDGRYSSLVLGGRGGLPPDPGGVLPSPLVFDERLVADPAVTGASPRPTSARFAFLADAEKAWPRLRGDQPAFGCTY